MFYEESVIDEVLHFRTTPDGEWRPIGPKVLTGMLLSCREAVRVLAAPTSEAVK